MSEQPPLNNDIIIHSNNARTTRGVFQGLIDAVSQIQQFAVIERTGQEIPEDFLAIRGKLNFFNVGMGNGFFEGLIFAFLSAIVIPIMSDGKLRAMVTQYFRLAESDLFLWTLNCLPIIIMGSMCCYLSKYRIGIITRKAVDSLLVGRLLSLIIKGGIIFCILYFLGTRMDPDSAWQVSNWITYWPHRPTISPRYPHPYARF